MESPPSDPAGQQALQAVAEAFGASGGLLFEPSPSGEASFQATASLAVPAELSRDVAISGRSLLPRWLRVNASALPVPDTIGVFDALPILEQEVLRSLRGRLAVPLLDDEDLVGWISLNDVEIPSSHAIPIDARLRDIAVRLKDARATARDREHAEAAIRSNRLSVAGQMAAGIAHEVRNPLAAVRSMVQLVRTDTAPPDDHHRLLDNVVSEVDRVNVVLSRMMALGRPTANRDERTDFAALASDAVNFCQAYAKQRGEMIRVSLPERLWVQGDAHELRQVLVNLLLNACQACRAGQTIVVDGASKPSSVGNPAQIVVRITDPGDGMPRHVLERAFDPFFTTKQDGGGLGLSICRDAVRRHGGNITIASELGVGTVVSVELPQAPHDTNSSR